MKKILATSALALTMACGMAFAVPDSKQSAPAGNDQQMLGASSSPQLMAYFWFENLPKGEEFKISSGQDVTGLMGSSKVVYYTELQHGTYQIKMKDGSFACSFVVNYTNVDPTKSNPGGHGLAVQAVSAAQGYTCDVSSDGGFNPLVTISPSN